MKKTPAAQPLGAIGFITPVLQYICILYGLLCCFLIPVQAPFRDYAYLGAAIGIGVMATAFALRRARLVLLLATGGVYAIVVALGWERLVDGAIYIAQLVAFQFSRLYSQFFDFGPPGPEHDLDAVAFFLPVVAFLLAAYLGWAVLWRQSFWWSMAIVAPLFWCPLELHGLPPGPAVTLLFAGVLSLLLKGQAGRRDRAATAKVSLVALGVCLFVVGLAISIVPKNQYQPSGRALETRHQLQLVGDEILLRTSLNSLPGTFAGAPLSGRERNVSLSQAGDLRFGNEISLRVRGEFSGRIYLRGFSSAVYTGQAWQPLPEGSYNPDAFVFEPLAYPLGRGFGQAPVQEDLRELELENLQERSNFLFTPYALQTVSVENGTVEYIDDAYIQPQREGLYTAGVYEWISDVDTYLQAGTGDEDTRATQMYGTDGSGNTTEGVGAVFPQEGRLRFVYNGQALTTGGAATSSSLTPLQLSQEEQAYIDYLSATYTQLPEGTGDGLRQLATDAGIQAPRSAWEWPVVAMQVAEYVKASGRYTTQPGAQPRDADFATYFLTQSRQGYCVHFATAATAMLRSLGVPARYVEGYVVTGRTGGNPNWVNVPNKNAHAWVEVWVPLIGWLPLEATPGGAAALQGTGQGMGDTSAPETSASRPASSSASSSSSSSSSQSSTSSSGSGRQNRGQSVLQLPWYAWLGFCLVLALVAVTLIYGRNYVDRRKRFRAKDANRAVQDIFVYLDSLAAFGYQPSKEARRLAGRARFSQHTITKTEQELVLEEAETARKSVLKELRFPKKWWFYLRGL